MTPVESLIEALRNVRWGRAALKVDEVDAANFHLKMARYWYGAALGAALAAGGILEASNAPLLKRRDRTLGWINKFSVEVLAAAVRAAPFERISEMYESQAIAESGPGEFDR